MRPLEGKAALITGASRGIGKGIALSFAEAGADLVLSARSMDDLEQTAAEARAFGVRAEPIHMDAYDLDQVYAAVDAVSERFGKIDVPPTGSSAWAVWRSRRRRSSRRRWSTSSSGPEGSS